VLKPFYSKATETYARKRTAEEERKLERKCE